MRVDALVLWCRAFCLSLLVCGVWSLAQAEDLRVVDVQFEGLVRLDKDALQLRAGVSPGELSVEQVSEAVKQLYRTGFFSSVQGVVRDDSILVFKLKEKQVVRKTFVKGNDELSDKELAEVLNFGQDRYFRVTRVKELMTAAQALYQSKGYYDAQLDYQTKEVGGDIDVVFLVTEGKKYNVTEVKIEGLDRVEEDDLLDIIETREYVWWKSWLLGSGKLNEETLKIDRQRLRQYLSDNGYVNAQVSEATVDKTPEGLKVSFSVVEGDQHKVGVVSIVGDDLIPEGEIIEELSIQTGDIFSGSATRDDSFKISEKYGDRGYAFANVVPQTSLGVNKDEEPVVNIAYQVEKGKLVHVNQVKVRGNEKTYENVIRRTLVINEQEQYATSKVKRSEILLKRQGYFDEATVTTEPAPGLDDAVDLLVNVKEGSTGSFSAGAGFSSTDGALLNAQLSERNMLGTGRTVSVNFDFGRRRNNLVLSLSDPRINDSFVSGAVDLMRTERLFTDFDRKMTGTGLTLGYPLEQLFGEAFEDIGVSAKYEFLNIDIFNVNPERAARLVLDSVGETTSSAVTPTLQRNTIDNPLNPTSGSRQILSYEYAGLGGNQDYTLLTFRNTMFFPTVDMEAGPIVFSLRNRVGYGESGNEQDFPLFKRFFPGGINSVRGFQNRTLGPVDENGQEYGGSKEFVTNFELIFPLVTSAGLKGVVFFDIGEAFDDNQQISFSDLRRAYGAGFRWFSPLGPIRIEFGIPMGRQEGEDSLVTLFSFGAPI